MVEEEREKKIAMGGDSLLAHVSGSASLVKFGANLGVGSGTIGENPALRIGRLRFRFMNGNE